MSYLERRIDRLEERLDSSVQRSGNVFDRMEMREELRDLKSELKCRREMGYSDYDDDIEINKNSEEYGIKKTVMQRIFDCLKKKK